MACRSVGPKNLDWRIFIPIFNWVTFQQLMWRPKLMIIIQNPEWYDRSQENVHRMVTKFTDGMAEAVLQGSRIFATGTKMQCTKEVVLLESHHLHSKYKIHLEAAGFASL